MKKYNHNEAIITVPDEAKNEATLEYDGETFQIKRKGKARDLGEFVESIKPVADRLRDLKEAETRTKVDCEACENLFARQKAKVSAMKADDFDSDAEFMAELRHATDEIEFINQKIERARNQHRSAARTLEDHKSAIHELVG